MIAKTNETSARVFPVVLNVDHLKFYDRLERIVGNNDALAKAEEGNVRPLLLLRKPYWSAMRWRWPSCS